MDVIDELIAHCEAWEPWARVMGNVCAGDAAQALRSLRAENAELQHELTKGIHTCGPTCRKTPRCAEMADLRAELAECKDDAKRFIWLANELGLCIMTMNADPSFFAEDDGDAVTAWRKAIDAARKGEGE